MMTTLTVLLAIALVGVLGALFAGVLSMGRSGEARYARRSNRLMIARVTLQGLVIVLLGLIWLVNKS